MIEDYEDLFVPRPFWFVKAELLRNLCYAEIDAVGQLFAKFPDLRKLFDAPEPTIPQRKACFELLAHRKIIDIIYETIDQQYEQSPVLSDEQSRTLTHSQNLVSRDAPAWVLETNEVAELLPSRIHRALPESLHEESFYRRDPAKDEAARLAANTLSTVEQIQFLTNGVIEQQVRRLETRWAANATSVIGFQLQRSKKRKRLSKRDKQQTDRDALIAEIADTTNTQAEFLQKMDERKVPPLLTWRPWLGWRLTYQKFPHFQKLIQQDKSRAIKRHHERRGR